LKTDTVFVCNECGKQMLKWMGRCPGCGEWNSVSEKALEAPRDAPHRQRSADGQVGAVLSISEVRCDAQPRLKTGVEELDRVLGGGIVHRSLVLVAGDPGIGKSTLLMQGLAALSASGRKVLYVSGEESAEQLKMRAERLGVDGQRFLVLMENQLESIVEQVEESECSVAVIDSVQSVFSRTLPSGAGSVSQVRHVAGRILDSVKRGSFACIIVGHVTKGGDIAGPKVLEHMVDTVLYFEGDRGHPYRILRAVKNRFGSASEIGVFEMGDRGLRCVANPSELFLAERPQSVSGSVVTALVEGSRPILAEIQGLVTGPVPGQGRRTCLGIDSQRLALMIAVLEKKLGLPLANQDVFINAVGGIRAVEPAADLAIAAALLSSFVDRSVAPATLVFGEVGLAGEVRRVFRAEARINEAARLGFTRIVAPRSNVDAAKMSGDFQTLGISHISELARLILDAGR
jgi:DNA repair protein RadA/Sms